MFTYLQSGCSTCHTWEQESSQSWSCSFGPAKKPLWHFNLMLILLQRSLLQKKLRHMNTTSTATPPKNLCQSDIYSEPQSLDPTVQRHHRRFRRLKLPPEAWTSFSLHPLDDLLSSLVYFLPLCLSFFSLPVSVYDSPSLSTSLYEFVSVEREVKFFFAWSSRL